jgi:hypothetical protein
MAKRFIISEEEKRDIRSRYGLITEQSDEVRLKKAVQCFLNKKGFRDNNNQPLKVDGLLAGKSAEALRKYQVKIGVDADGVWGPMTQNKMPDKDVQLFKQCISDEGSLIDKGLHMFGLD